MGIGGRVGVWEDLENTGAGTPRGKAPANPVNPVKLNKKRHEGIAWNPKLAEPIYSRRSIHVAGYWYR